MGFAMPWFGMMQVLVEVDVELGMGGVGRHGEVVVLFLVAVAGQVGAEPFGHWVRLPGSFLVELCISLGAGLKVVVPGGL